MRTVHTCHSNSVSRAILRHRFPKGDRSASLGGAGTIVEGSGGRGLDEDLPRNGVGRVEGASDLVASAGAA